MIRRESRHILFPENRIDILYKWIYFPVLEFSQALTYDTSIPANNN